MTDSRGVGILGVPLDLGAGRRGTDMGPSAIRFAGLAERLRRLGVAVHDHGYVAAAAPETRVPGDERLRFGREIVRTCLRLRDRVKWILSSGETPVILGGDHSIAMGSVAGTAAHADGRIGLLWIDAHADLNTPETSPSGNVHGMPLAVLLGKGDAALLAIGGRKPVVSARHAALLGVRDVDPGERELIRELGLAVYTMKELDERGTSTCIREALARVTKGTKGFHLSFDMDVLDPEYAPGVGTPVPGGLTYREAHLACELVAETGRLLSMDVVEVNPILDERNRTADLAVQLILSALGKRIY
ncbi:MAG: arginase [Planctomycetes bacterium]|nr:arginase [Planctomycetota bacterium]